MTQSPRSLFGALRVYAGKVQTMRNTIRTERFLASLPADIRKDIGWPDAHRFGAAGEQ